MRWYAIAQTEEEVEQVAMDLATTRPSARPNYRDTPYQLKKKKPKKKKNVWRNRK